MDLEVILKLKDTISCLGNFIFIKKMWIFLEKICSSGESKKKLYLDKLEVLCSPNTDTNWSYNTILLKHFVPRRCQYYYSKKKTSLKNIKSELQRTSSARNIILIGKAGVGKSTALKWLFVKSYIKNYEYVYLNAQMFSGAKSTNTVCKEISEKLNPQKPSLVFFDGLDELRYLSSNKNELEKFLDYFDSKSGGNTPNNKNRFVITTRTEHFLLHHIFKKGQTAQNRDRYRIYEILPLNPKEAFNVCLSIKHLSKCDDENDFSHFTDKWPLKDTSKEYLLSERAYKKYLKKYLKKYSEKIWTMTFYCQRHCFADMHIR